MTANQVAYYKATEEARSHRAQEAIQSSQLDVARHQAQSQRLQAQAALGQASAAARQAAAREGELSESMRHNLQTEQQQAWFNQTTTTEARTHNRATEAAQMFDYTSQDAYRKAMAQASSMQAQNSAKQAEAAMRQSSAALSQAQTAARNAQTRESELAESIRTNLAKEQELARHQIAVEGETQRHNQQQEYQAAFSAQTDRLKAAADARRAQSSAIEAEAATKRAEAAMSQAETAKTRLPYQAFADITKGVRDFSMALKPSKGFFTLGGAK